VLKFSAKPLISPNESFLKLKKSCDSHYIFTILANSGYLLDNGTLRERYNLKLIKEFL